MVLKGKWLLMGLSMLGEFTSASLLFAQEPAQPGAAPAAPARTQAGARDREGARERANAGQARPSTEAATKVDSMLAECLILDNQNEIAAAKLALKKSESDDIKEFATMMERDHSQFIEELQPFASHRAAAGRQPATGGRNGNAGDRNRSNDVAPERTRRGDSAAEDRAKEGIDRAVRAADAAVGQDGQNPNRDRATPVTPPNLGTVQTQRARADHDGSIFLQIKKELAEECRNSLEMALNEKEGAEFDKCYMNHQLMAHMQMVDTLKVFERHASPEFKQVLSKGRKTAETHLEHAKQALKKVDGIQTASRKGESVTE